MGGTFNAGVGLIIWIKKSHVKGSGCGDVKWTDPVVGCCDSKWNTSQCTPLLVQIHFIFSRPAQRSAASSWQAGPTTTNAEAELVGVSERQAVYTDPGGHATWNTGFQTRLALPWPAQVASPCPGNFQRSLFFCIVWGLKPDTVTENCRVWVIAGRWRHGLRNEPTSVSHLLSIMLENKDVTAWPCLSKTAKNVARTYKGLCYVQISRHAACKSETRIFEGLCLLLRQFSLKKHGNWWLNLGVSGYTALKVPSNFWLHILPMLLLFWGALF
jgi:hypothetical protein